MRGLAIVLLALLAACSAARKGGRKIELDLAYAGNTTFTERDLRKAIVLDLEDIGRRSSPKSAIDDAAYSLLEFYRKHGFVDAVVDYDVEERGKDALSATFRITEGPRCVLASAHVVGDRELDEDELLAAIGLDDLRPDDPSPRWFVQSEAEDAARDLESYFVSRGYLEADVAEPQVELDAAHARARLVLVVSAGVRYRVASVPKVEGGVAAVDHEIDLRDFVGKPMAPRVPLDIRGRIEEAYEQRGYPEVRAQARPYERDENGRVELAFDVTPGPRVTVAKVEVRGNKKTKKRNVLEDVEFAPGDLYDVRKVRESFKQLYKTGLYRRVRVEVEAGESDQRTLLVEVEELPSTELFAEPGYGSYEGLRVLLGARENNVLGTGWSLNGEALLAERAHRLVAGLSDRKLLGTRYEGSWSVYEEFRNEPSFDKLERGSAVSIAREVGEHLRLLAMYRWRRSEVSDADITDPDAVDALQDVDISSISITGTFDDRDSVFVPSEGSQLKLTAEFANSAIGSELDFLRLKLSQASFFALRPSTVFGFSYRNGVIYPLEDTDVIPLQERFYNGGENTVRSFEEKELGPKDSSTGEPVGGEAYNVFSVELRQRLRRAFECALFYDVGNVESDAADLFAFNDLGQAIGAGLRYLLPIGPVRLDVGWNPDPGPGDDTWVAHFSVGSSF